MLGASLVDEHSIAELAVQHNQLLNALLLAADQSKVGLLCGFSSSGPAQKWRRPLRRADLPARSALLGPELDRLQSSISPLREGSRRERGPTRCRLQHSYACTKGWAAGRQGALL